ncbi:efflux transporter outer membrane subunit [Fundidesulfovibrio soli]|uniref:efflux transporter outer membrane subunit n=1 Tax=Fundidesulfovibrio soli TaxID=2922716 RepID=UPI001FAFFF8A|nr:efflux transporter outer membrane subunit [Fundidesulfovibrio soli]
MAVFLLITMTGCSVGPDYKRPHVTSPDQFRYELKGNDEVANTAWWKQFGDPVLEDLIGTALRENKDLLIASARIEEFVGRYVTVRGDFFPNTSGGFTPAKTQLPGATTASTSYTAVLNGSWEIDFWGRVRRQAEAARAELLGTEEARRAVILTLVGSVVRTYLDILVLDKQLDIANKTAASRKKSLDIFRLRLKHGFVSEVVVSQSDAEYRETLARIPEIEKAIAQTENALSILIGRNPGKILRDRGLDALRHPDIPQGLPSELLERRPDIRLAEQKLIAANAQIGVAKSLYFPTISLTGLLGATSPELSDLFTPGTGFARLAGSITMPLLNFGRIKGTVKASEAVQQQAMYAYFQTVQGAFRDVDDALVDHVKSQEQRVALAQQVDALANAAKLSLMRYDEGYASYIEVLDAERSLFNAQLTLANVDGNIFRSQVNLFKSLGGGWVAVAESESPRAPVDPPGRIVPLP